jgi:hypothetical protein
VKKGERPTRFLVWGKDRHPRLSAAALVLAIGSLVATQAWDGRFAVLFIALAVLLLAFVSWPGALIIGSDGLRLGAFLRPRFVPFADVVGVARNSAGVRIALRDGSVHVFEDASGKLEERLRHSLTVFREHERGPRVEALVARSGRRVGEWIAGVRALLAAHGTEYRDASVSPEHLWRVAEDPAADETARVGAAIALRAVVDDAGRTRLQEIASSCVSPRIRVALDKAATAEDDADLAEALRTYDEEEALREPSL